MLACLFNLKRQHLEQNQNIFLHFYSFYFFTFLFSQRFSQ